MTMDRNATIRALLGAMLSITIFPMSATARADAPVPEGREWHLVSFAADGGPQPLPGDVDVMLRLDKGGRASGFTGCQGLAADYVIDGESLTFSNLGQTTEVGCPKEAVAVEEAFLALLPSTARWAIDTSANPADVGLTLFDPAGDPFLQFMVPTVGGTYADLRALTALVETQQTEIEALRARIREVERRQ